MRTVGTEFFPDGSNGGPTVGYGEYMETLTTHQHAYTVLGGLSEERDFDKPFDASTDESVLEDLEDEVTEQEGLDALEATELAIRDVSELDYIDYRRTPTGIHCMDYCMDEPGVQLPGGELWTRVANHLMSPTSRLKNIPEAIATVGSEILQAGIISPVHNKCAAAANIVPALAINERYMSQARDEFTAPILEDLGLNYSKTDQDIDTAILVGARVVERLLWKESGPEGEEGTFIATSVGLPYEELDKSGKIVAGGLGVLTTTNRFNNLRFRQDHKLESGKEVGLYAVTLGAYRDILVARGLKEKKIAREVMGAALFTHGLAAHLGGDYLRARVVAPMDNARLSIWQPEK